ncbi:L-lactate dehydrogenase [Calderihabitans maritimus]|uniref:L-lactate dehydrogenase n=1 Tax=Calderihabitans maritimus TaxID=1246530 RepID=A0A1Z5HQK6_9FIRM|nr:L-lactate dehydrogenase [Calderihabitans maritimus]GAW91794.1 l-lactate dehydrogenase [Calderihabitans maritimus]
MAKTNHLEDKISIIGAGMVGSTIAYALMISGLAKQLVLVDINRGKAAGEAMDLSHSASFVKPVHIKAGSYPDCAGSRIVIITAGANQKPGETRLDLVEKNARIIKNIVENVRPHCDNPIWLIVTNPVDVLTYLVLKVSNSPPSQVIGSGTVLDSSRFRHLLSQYCEVDARNVHAHVIGEHGDSEVLVWSTANIAGIPVEKFFKMVEIDSPAEIKDKIDRQVRRAAYEIIERKGATYYAIGLAVRRIVESILRDEHSVLTVSNLVGGIYDVNDICLSLPCVIGKNGIIKTLRPPLTEEEIQQFRSSALSLQKVAGRVL